MAWSFPVHYVVRDTGLVDLVGAALCKGLLSGRTEIQQSSSIPTMTPTPTSAPGLGRGEWADVSSYNDKAVILDIIQIYNGDIKGTVTTIQKECQLEGNLDNGYNWISQGQFAVTPNAHFTIFMFRGLSDNRQFGDYQFDGWYNYENNTFTLTTDFWLTNSPTGTATFTLTPQTNGNVVSQVESTHNKLCVK
jgi:hypothetical protein